MSISDSAVCACAGRIGCAGDGIRGSVTGAGCGAAMTVAGCGGGGAGAPMSSGKPGSPSGGGPPRASRHTSAAAVAALPTAALPMAALPKAALPPDDPPPTSAGPPDPLLTALPSPAPSKPTALPRALPAEALPLALPIAALPAALPIAALPTAALPRHSGSTPASSVAGLAEGFGRTSRSVCESDSARTILASGLVARPLPKVLPRLGPWGPDWALPLGGPKLSSVSSSALPLARPVPGRVLPVAGPGRAWGSGPHPAGGSAVASPLVGSQVMAAAVRRVVTLRETISASFTRCSRSAIPPIRRHPWGRCSCRRRGGRGCGLPRLPRRPPRRAA